jgi:hypothetical protein
MTKTWRWLKDNLGAIPNLAILVIGVLIVWLDMSGRASPGAVRDATLALLSLIGASLLMSHATNNRLQEAAQDILKQDQAANAQWQHTAEEILRRLQQPSIEQVLLPHARWMDEIDQKLWSAKEVWVLSRTCIRIWQDYRDQFKRLLKGRGGVRLMLVDPNGGAVKMLVKSARGFEHFDDFKLRQANIEAHLAQLAWRCLQPEGKGLQVRTINYLPAWTLIFIDPESERGTVYVELATYRSGPRNRPTFLLTADSSPQLFQVFRDEFETMWKRAQALDPAAYEREASSDQSLDQKVKAGP